MKFFTLFSAALLSAASVFAEPAIFSVSNAASYLSTALPNGGVAQGSIFSAIGSGLGPEIAVTPPRLPLETTLAGVSVRVVIGTTTLDAIPIVAYDGVVSAILPSSTPIGQGEVTVAYQNERSEPFPIKVVRNALGIFAINQAGTGPGIFTDANFAVNTLLNAANPGSTSILWGTGLGPVTGNEANAPLPGDMPNLDVKVYVGGVQAQVTYRGRSGCCAGLDQIAFTIPTNVVSCYAPVTVTVNGIPSNSVTMSIAQSGRICSDAGGFSTTELTQAQSTGSIAVGSVGLQRTTNIFDTDEATVDRGLAQFTRYTTSELIAVQPSKNMFPKGGCYVYAADSAFENTNDGRISDPVVVPEYLDAGEQIDVRGSVGTKQIPAYDVGLYAEDLAFEPPLYLEPGSYAVSNGAGGDTVKGFQSQVNVPGNLTWTNRASINTAPAGQPVRVTWDGPTSGVVYISGFSTGGDLETGEVASTAFICTAAAADKQFSVPAYVIDSLPASGPPEDFLESTLAVGLFTDSLKFTAPGLNVGFLSHGNMTSKGVTYRPIP